MFPIMYFSSVFIGNYITTPDMGPVDSRVESIDCEYWIASVLKPSYSRCVSGDASAKHPNF